jgi:hypothetical protein
VNYRGNARRCQRHAENETKRRAAQRRDRQVAKQTLAAIAAAYLAIERRDRR